MLIAHTATPSSPLSRHTPHDLIMSDTEPPPVKRRKRMYVFQTMNLFLSSTNVINNL
jgi:hypothetical protein